MKQRDCLRLAENMAARYGMWDIGGGVPSVGLQADIAPTGGMQYNHNIERKVKSRQVVGRASAFVTPRGNTARQLYWAPFISLVLKT
jgi:hypothetical protein